MPEVILLPRNPKGSEMTLSNQVKQSIDEATINLREALAFAARTEHPVTVSTLSDLLCRVESLEQVDELMSQFASKNDEKTNRYRG